MKANLKTKEYADKEEVIEKLENFCNKNSFEIWTGNKVSHYEEKIRYVKGQNNNITFVIDYSSFNNEITLTKIKYLTSQHSKDFKNKIMKESHFQLFKPVKNTFDRIKKNIKDFNEKYGSITN